MEPAPPDSSEAATSASYLPLAALRLMIVAAVFLLYSNSTGGQLHFDELKAIPGSSETWADAVSRDHMSGSLQWRPLATGALAVQHSFFGESPNGYRRVSAALHAANALVLLEAALLWGFPALAAGIAAGVFAVHPAATEPVNWTVAQSELIATLFMLMAFCMLAPRASENRRLSLLTSSGCLLCALMAKEQYAGAAGAVLALGHLMPGLSGEARARTRLAALAWCGAVVLFLALRAASTGFVATAGLASLSANPLAHLPPVGRWANASLILGFYLWKLAVPVPLVSLYSYGDFTMHPVNSLPALLGLAGLAACLPLAILAWRKPHPLWIAPAGALALLFPVSNLPIAIGTIFGDRLLYAPAVFLALGLGWLLAETIPARIRDGAARRWLPIALAVMVAVPYGWLTFRRNSDWANQCRRFAADLSHQPRSIMVLVNLAGCAAEDGDLEAARQFADRSLRILPDYPAGLLMAARIYTASRQFDEADGLWKEAIGSKRREMEAVKGPQGKIDGLYFDEARSMRDMGDPVRARAALRRWYEEQHYSPADAALLLGDQAKAYGAPVVLMAIDEILAVTDRSPDALAFLGEYLLQQGDLETSRMGEKLLLEAVEKNPRQTFALAALGGRSLLLGELDNADRFLSQCLDADPGDLNCLQVYPLALIRMGRKSKARELFKRLEAKGVNIPPDVRVRAEGADTGRAILPRPPEPSAGTPVSPAP